MGCTASSSDDFSSASIDGNEQSNPYVSNQYRIPDPSEAPKQSQSSTFKRTSSMTTNRRISYRNSVAVSPLMRSASTNPQPSYTPSRLAELQLSSTLRHSQAYSYKKPATHLSNDPSFQRRPGESLRDYQRRVVHLEYQNVHDLLSEIELLVQWEDFDEIVEMKKCRQSTLYTASWQGVKVVIKRFLPEFANSPFLVREIQVMLDLRHEDIVPLHGACFDPPFIVYPYFHRGDFASLLYGPTSKPLTWTTKRAFISSLVNVLAFMHQHNPTFPHGDLRPSHVLVSRDWDLKIGGFGTALRLASHRRDGEEAATVNLVDLSCVAPEVLRGMSSFRTTVDIYALGIMMFAIAFQTEPFAGMRKREIAEAVGRGLRPALPLVVPSDVPSDIVDLMEDCWAQNPDDRIEIDEVKQRLQALP